MCFRPNDDIVLSLEQKSYQSIKILLFNCVMSTRQEKCNLWSFEHEYLSKLYRSHASVPIIYYHLSAEPSPSSEFISMSFVYLTFYGRWWVSLKITYTNQVTLTLKRRAIEWKDWISRVMVNVMSETSRNIAVRLLKHGLTVPTYKRFMRALINHYIESYVLGKRVSLLMHCSKQNPKT